MKILQLLRSEPLEEINAFIQIVSKDNESTVVELFCEDVDWSDVVDKIFDHEKVICWW